MASQDELVFELLTEELPPAELYSWAKLLSDSLATMFTEQELNYDAIYPIATPRRLGVYVNGLALQQPQQRVQRKGPALKVAYDEQGYPTQAGLGFAKSCGVDINELTVYETDKGSWLYLDQQVPGKTIYELLPDMLNKALKQMPVNKMMYWGEGRYAFMRPVHNVLTLYGSDIIAIELLGHQASAQTYGHRFHSPDSIKLEHARDYEQSLREHYVVVDFNKRRQMISQQAQALAHEYQAQLVMPDELLDEVTSLVEWPVALQGHFDKRFLQVPQEVLILSMQANQKYFALLDKDGQILPYFITISNIDSHQPEVVVKGNERVMEARLADAEFFYEVDQKRTLADYAGELESITFQKDLGSLADKCRRLEQLVVIIADQLNVAHEAVKRAATLAKADLVTDMVQEFTELQGTMGRYYALASGESQQVAQAIEEHYWPKHAGDQLPESQQGQILALADRLDDLVGMFGVNMMPTADKDPYGLRRSALGGIRLMIEKELPLDLIELLTAVKRTYQLELPNSEVVSQVAGFCQERLKTWALEQGYTAEVYAAVAAKGVTKPLEWVQRMQAVDVFQKLPQAQALAQANKRVSNILNKQNEEEYLGSCRHEVLQEQAEQKLAHAVIEYQNMSAQSFAERLQSLAELEPFIDDFFEQVMVNADDPILTKNRLALLKEVRELFLEVADISYL